MQRWKGEAFGVRLSFLALFYAVVCFCERGQSSPKCKSGRRDSRTPRRCREIRTPLIADAFGVRLSFSGAFPSMAHNT